MAQADLEQKAYDGVMKYDIKGCKAVAEQAVAEMATEDTELISIYYGEDMTEEDAEALSERLSEIYPDCDIEVNAGGQPVYYCIIAVE